MYTPFTLFLIYVGAVRISALLMRFILWLDK